MDLFDLDDHIPNLGIDPSTENDRSRHAKMLEYVSKRLGLQRNAESSL